MSLLQKLKAGKLNPSKFDTDVIRELLENAWMIGDNDALAAAKAPNEFHLERWPRYNLYRYEDPYGDDVAKIAFGYPGTTVVAHDDDEANILLQAKLPGIRTFQTKQIVPGPLPREYYQSMSDEDLQKLAYEMYVDGLRKKTEQSRLEKKRLEDFKAKCKEGDKLNLRQGLDFPCGSKRIDDTIDELGKYVENMDRNLPKVPATIDEVDLDPIMYADSPLKWVKEKANKLITGED